MSKIGIGIITVQNRKINPNIYNWISGPTQFYVFVDKDRMGCSYGRNECIKHLYDAGCDYIFLFDDDTYPTMKGWEEKIIDWAFTNKVNLLAMVDQKHDKIIRTVNDNNRNDTVVYDGGFAGPFVFLTRKAIETIGYYNTEYKDYSWEDVSYCYRAKLAGLCGAKDGMYTPVWLSIYIHDEDVFNENPIPSFPADYKQKKVEENQPIAQCEC
jgi:hypothetical protein